MDLTAPPPSRWERFRRTKLGKEACHLAEFALLMVQHILPHLLAAAAAGTTDLLLRRIAIGFWLRDYFAWLDKWVYLAVGFAITFKTVKGLIHWVRRRK